DIAMDSNNTPHICYNNANGLNYAVLTGNQWSVQTVDPTGSNGALALNSQNNPCIVYSFKNESSSGIRYAFWTGQKWNIQTVVLTSTPYYFAMILDSKGNPHIAYSYQRYLSNG